MMRLSISLPARRSMLAGAALFLIAASGCQGNRSDLPPVHLNPNMDDQQRYDAQEENDFFADGRAMRAPVEGTVARGFLKADDHFYRARNEHGRLVDELPKEIELNADLLKRGRERYDIYCAPCHGESGRGNGPVTKHGEKFKVPPPSYHQDKFRAMPLGYFYDVIANGKGTMLSYAAQVPESDRWAISMWVRTLQAYGTDQKWNDDPAAKASKPEAQAKDAGGAK